MFVYQYFNWVCSNNTFTTKIKKKTTLKGIIMGFGIERQH